MSNPIRVLIADDHPIFRHGLRQIIEQAPELVVVEEAEDGETAWRKLRAGVAEVAVLDIDMPGRDGFEIARAIRDEQLKIGVVFLTMHKDERFFIQALDLEVKGYILKDGALAEIVHCIRAVAAGQEYVSPQLTTFLLNRSRAPQAGRREATAGRADRHRTARAQAGCRIQVEQGDRRPTLPQRPHHRTPPRPHQPETRTGRAPRPAQIRARTSVGVVAPPICASGVR